MRVLLIQPTPNTIPLGFDRAALPEPLGLEIIAASIPDHDVKIHDLRIDPNLEAVLESFVPDIVGVTGFTMDVYSALDVLKRAKEYSEEIFTIAGGHHATLVPTDFYQPYVDAICLGDGEAVLPQLVSHDLKRIPNLIWRDGIKYVDNGRVFEKPGSEIEIPIPRRDLIDGSHYHFYSDPMAAMLTGRGCPCRCNFCSVWQFNGGVVRQLSAERVVRELRTIDCDRIGFVDDNLLINYKRDDEIADRIKAEGLEREFLMQCRTDCIVKHKDLVEKWVDIGLMGVLVGFESASNDLLQLVNKKNDIETNNRAIKILQDLDVIIWAAFIIDPRWGVDDFRRLEQYIIEHQLTPIQYTVLTPLPGTDLYEERFDDLLTHDYRCFDTLHSVLPTKLPREQFYRELARLQGLRHMGKWYEWLSSGKVGINILRCGSGIAKQLSNWESYVEFDPVLGGFTK